MYTIGGFARLSHVPVKTLRFYDEIGLLRPARVAPSSGYRYYTAAQIEQLNRVLVFKDLGFSLQEIRALVAERVPPEQIRGMLRLRHQALERRVGRETARLARAAARLALIEGGQPGPAHEVAVRDTGPRLVASLRDTLGSYAESARLFDELDHHAGGGHKPRQRAAVWHACAAGAVECEALVFLPSPLASRGRVRVYELPPQRVASLVYRGDHDFLPAYRALHCWIGASGVEVVGPKREVYLDEGGADGESVTEIQVPIAIQGEA
jgi:DNA-binding transcriptional MerR regulator